MILYNNNDIEKDSTYSFLLGRLETPSIEDLVTVANNMLQLFGDTKESESLSLPTEYFMLQQVSSELNERKQCITRVLDTLESKDLLNCEEISIVDYGCGQAFASLCLLNWFFEKKGNLDNIKTIKIVDKDLNMLRRALLHFSILFPTVDVVAYQQDLLKEDFSIECNSVLTINLFSHVISEDIKFVDLLKGLILKGHNLLMHNIILDEISSKSYSEKLPVHYLNYTSNNIKDYTGCESISDCEFTLKKRTSEDELIKLFRYVVLSRTDILKLNLPKIENNFTRLYPGEPLKKLFNVPQNILWFEQPLSGTSYCDNLDDNTKISLEENYVSPDFEPTYKKSADILNPHTIKECAEMFYQSHIAHALSCGLECGQEIFSLYEKAANNGITEAYNNLGILKFYDSDNNNSEKEGIEYFKLAAKGGSALAMLNLASYYMTQGIEDEGIKFYSEASKKGNATACYNLALIYDFGLYKQEVNKQKAEELYLKCLESMKDEKELDNRDYSLQSNCCLNLILLLNNKEEHYLKLYDVYLKAKKPSDSLKYCREILQIKYTNRFSKDIMKTLSLSETDKEKDFMKYNRAIFLYNGLTLKSFDVKIESNTDSAIMLMKSLVESDSSDWEEREKYAYSIYAYWINSKQKGLGGQDEQYWRKAAEANVDHACAYLTNVTLCGDLKEEEKKEILQHYAFADGCISCHECINYNKSLRCCPKAQLNWAKDYEKDDLMATKLIRQSAEQKYDRALFYLGFRLPIKENMPSFKESFHFNFLSNFMLVAPPDEYKNIFPILAKDKYYYYLQEAADLRYTTAQSIMPFVAKLRADDYNYIYWSSVFNSRSDNEEIKHSLLTFFESKCKRSIETYFKAETMCEKQYLSLCEDIVKHTDDVNFICSLANFYLEGNQLYKAQEYYNIAKEKGSTVADERINYVNDRIAESEAEERRNSSYDDYEDYHDYERDTWYAMTDGMYGDMPEGFDGDYDFLGF
jgi:TPR repeat protein